VKVEQQRAIARHHSREHGQELRIARPPRHPGKLSGDIMGKRANPGHGLIIEQASRGKHDKPLKHLDTRRKLMIGKSKGTVCRSPPAITSVPQIASLHHRLKLTASG
jgi:hypothetical protein